MRPWLLSLLLLTLLPATLQAAIEVYEFQDPALEARYYQLIQVLRCPKCQNQNIAGSNAPLSADLRSRVHIMLHQGHSDGEIVEALVARYGSFITYRPPLNLTTLLLWFGPLLGVMVAVVLVARWIRNNQQESPLEDLNPTERQQLSQALNGQEEPRP